VSKKEFNWTNFLIGAGAGYFLAKELTKDSEPVYIAGQRIHHYLLGLGALATENEFLQGLCIGASLEDLPDLLEDLDSGLKNLANNIRKFQGKTPH